MSTPAVTPALSAPPRRSWKFSRTGGVDQVVIRDGADIAGIPDLDQKLWMALAMPTRGIEFDPKTADLLDTDKDGRIRPPEVIAAVEWIKSALRDPGDLIKGGDAVAIAAIKDPDLLAGAKRVLANLGKPEAAAVTLEDVSDQARIFAATKFNGDGVVPAEAADDEAVRQAVVDIIATLGPVPDRSGRPGINQANLDAFFAQAEAFSAWAHQATAGTDVLPLGPEGTAAAVAAVKAVKAKVDDYFARCRLAAFDARALAALNREEKEFLALAAKDLTITSDEIAALPLARIEAGRPLPLVGELNPAWEPAIAALAECALVPLLGPVAALAEADWRKVQQRLSAHAAWTAAKPVTAVEPLGLARLDALLAGPARAAIGALIGQDLAVEKENLQLAAVEKLIRFQRDLFEMITNYVNFADFYGRTQAVFQCGTLYLDARSCDLCIEVVDPGRHAALASLSGAFLAYCDISRSGGQKKTIVAVFTDGDSDNLAVGRNGVFYDRKGQDWDATITKVVANPISIREAFWMPYKKLIRFIEEQVAKRAAAGESASMAKLSDTATAVVTADKAAPAGAAPATAAPKKLDLGTIALVGTAIGGISALVGGFLQSLFGLGLWLPLGVVGLLLLISGPSMILAALKLRVRNLGPILDANGWAINTRARMNVPFGASLTRLAALPAGSSRTMEDPYAEKQRPWKTYLIVAAVVVLGYLWAIGRMDAYLPGFLQKAHWFGH